MKSTISVFLLSLSLGLSASASANGRAVDVQVTNLTNGTYFTPLLIAAHRRDLRLFQVGTSASGQRSSPIRPGRVTS